MLRRLCLGIWLSFLVAPLRPVIRWGTGFPPGVQAPGPRMHPSTPAAQQRKPCLWLHPRLLWAPCANIPLHTQDLILCLLHSAGIISAHVRPLVSNDFGCFYMALQ